MQPTKSLVIKNTGAYTLAGMLPFITGLFMLPIYTRYLTPSDYGILTLVSAFTAMLLPIISLQLNAALPRYYFDFKGFELKQFFSTIFYSVTLLSSTFLLFLHLTGDLLTDFMFPKANIPYLPYFMISLITVLMGQLSAVAQRLLVVREKGGAVLIRALFGIIIGIILGLWFVVYLRMGALGALIAGAIGGFATALLTCFMVKDFFVWSWKKEYFFQAFKYSWPIMPHAIGGYLFMYSDRIIMEKFVTLVAIGLYSIADRFSRILKVLVNAINDALNPNFMRLAHQDEQTVAAKFKAIIVQWSVLISIAYLGLAFFSEEAVIILTPEKYHAAYGLIPILLLGYIFRGLYCFASYPLFYLKKTTQIPAITFTAGAANIGLNLLLIPIIGIYGAAWATVFSFALTFFIANHLSSKVLGMKFDWISLLQVFVPMLVCASILFFIKNQSMVMKFSTKIFFLGIFSLFLWIRNFGGFRADVFRFARSVKLNRITKTSENI